jgi:hypothetical protein
MRMLQVPFQFLLGEGIVASAFKLSDYVSIPQVNYAWS